MRRALLLTDVPWIECVHCIVLFVTLYIVNSGELGVLLNFVDETDLVPLLLLLLFVGRLLPLLCSIQFYYWRSVPIHSLARSRALHCQPCHLVSNIWTRRTHRRRRHIIIVYFLLNLLLCILAAFISYIGLLLS